MKGSLIKQHRKFKGLTLEELAHGICSVSYLSKIEHNTIKASDEIYRLIGERLKIKLTDINQEFDESLYEDLIEWHSCIQWRDMEGAEQFKETCERALKENHNVELTNLYKVIKARHDMKAKEDFLPDDVFEELEHIYMNSNKEYQFFYHKTYGIQLLLKNKIKKALEHFKKTLYLLQKVHFDDTETYFHLCLTYTKVKAPVESNYYGEKALEGYKRDLDYGRIIDTYMLIALNYRYMDVFHLAEEYFLKLLKIGKNHLSQHDLRRVYHNLGYIYINQEKYEGAFKFLSKAREIPTPEKYFEVNTIHLLASSSYYCGELDKCWEFIEEGVRLASKYNVVFFTYSFYVFRNIIKGTTHNEDFIQKLEKTIIPKTRQLHEYERYQKWLLMLGDIYYEKRMYKKAAMNYKEANQYKFTQKKDLL